MVFAVEMRKMKLRIVKRQEINASTFNFLSSQGDTMDFQN